MSLFAGVLRSTVIPFEQHFDFKILNMIMK